MTSDTASTTAGTTTGFVPPSYPYDLLDPIIAQANKHEGGCVDLSIGTPVDPAPAAVVDALANSKSVPGYPPSIGTPALREAFAQWAQRQLGVQLDPATQVAATVGSKEFVAGLPHWLRLRSPQRDTVLYPAVSYPSYEMGALLAGARAVPVPMDENWSPQLGEISPQDAERALLLWMNTPGNPAGGLDDLTAAAHWGAEHQVPVFSDECYAEFTWEGSPRSILQASDPNASDTSAGTTNAAATGTATGIVAVHSLSKRSNLAGARVGFYAGDAELVDYLKEIRKHAGFMVPGPAQAAATLALADQQHVARQRERYYSRLKALATLLEGFGVQASLPRGGFYLWVPAPNGDAWGFVRQLATEIGLVVTPGEFFGAAGSGYVRIAAVATDDQMQLLTRRASTRSTSAH